MRSIRTQLIFSFVIITMIVITSCSSDGDNPVDAGGDNPEEEYQLPDLGVEKLEVPTAISDSAANGNIGAIQAESVIEMVNSIEDYYQQFDMGGSINKLKGIDVVSGWTKSWQVNELTVTLEYEDGWPDIIFLNMYYDGSDGQYTYNHWLKGYFSASKDPEFFAGALKLYEYGNPKPQIYFKWGEDEITGKYMDAEILGLFKMKYIYQMPDEPEGYSGFNYDDGFSDWVVDIYPDGHGRWTQYGDENFQTVISEGSW